MSARPDLPAAAGPAATDWKIAVVGAGPAGLALALDAARRLPRAELSLFDSRPLDRDVSGDPRVLALAQGSIVALERLGAWPADAAQAITEIRVSQVPPSPALPGLPAEVVMRAAELGQPRLGAVIGYGPLVAALQRAWLAAEAREPARLHTRFGAPVAAIKPVAGGVEVDAGIAETFDLAVVAEGGVFAEQPLRAVARDYGQTAWIGTATLEDAVPGLAVERFTREGPVALLPLKPGDDGRTRAALVWCVATAGDEVGGMSDAQRLAVLNQRLPAGVGRLVALSPLKAFALGLNAEGSLVDVAGRTVRIGNAAQTLHPVAGQGLNLGLRDAGELVQALRDAEGREALPRLLRGLDLRRAPDRWGTIAATDFLARSFTWQVPGMPAARSLGLAALAALPPLRRRLARRMMFGWR